MDNFMHIFGTYKKFSVGQERRLAYFGHLDRIREYFAPGDYPLHVDKIAKRLRENVGNEEKVEMDLLMGIPENVAIRLSELMTDDAANLDKEKQTIVQTARFFNENSAIRKYFETYDVTKFTIDHFNRVMNIGNFINVFETRPVVLSPTTGVVAPINAGTAEEFVMAFTPIERQEMFREMVLKHIPAAVITPPTPPDVNPYYDASAEAMFSKPGAFEAPMDIAGIERASRISSIILGVRKEAEIAAVRMLHPEDVTIAKKSIHAHFGLGEVKTPPEPISPTDGMVADYLKSARLLELQGHRPSSVSAALIRSNLPPSYLQGAMEMSVIDQAGIDTLNEHLVEKEDEKTRVRGSAAHSLEDLTGTTRRSIEREAQTMADVWHEMGGFQKMALAAVALYFVNRFRGISLGIGVAYFADKFLTKGQGAESLLNLAKKGGNVLARQTVGALDVRDIARRSEITAEFLSDYQADNMEEEATGFGLMTRIPLADLAKSFRMYGAGADSDWELSTDRNSPLMLRMREVARTEGWSRRYLQFFANPDNVTQVADALTYVFFRLAMRDAANGKDAEIVTAALRSSPTSNTKSTFEKLEDLGNEEAMASYVRLIEKGKEAASGETKTLGEFLAEEQGL